MPNFNQIILVGHVTRDPELKYTPSGVAVCEFGIATNHKYKDTDEVCFVDITYFDKQAEIIAEHVSKGDPLMVVGRLRQDKWTSHEGQARSKHCVVGDRFQFLPRSGDGGNTGRPATGGTSSKPAASAASEVDPLGDDDIPF